MKYLVISDIHLGHNVNKTMNIYENIKSYFKAYENLLSKLDVLFIAGDTFDTCLSTYQEDFIISLQALMFIVNWCHEHNIKLRILEGTPSHDWKQVNVVYEIIAKLNLKDKIDFKYIDTLYHEELLGKHILYIPDEYKENAEETLKDVKALMLKDNLEAFDMAIMHGAFHYQLPITLKSSHSEEEYLKIVKGYIHIGHIHTSSVYKRIIANGSFDRLAHNEEEDKGGVYVDGDKLEFLVNTNSMLFLTYDFTNEEDSNVLQTLNMIKHTIKKGSAIRFLVNDKEHFINMDKNIKLILSEYKVKIQVKDPLALKSIERNILKEKEIVSFEIRKDNILMLLEDSLKEEVIHNEITPKDVERMLEKMKKII